MRDHCSYEYAVIRVVPRVEREEMMNVGIIVMCSSRDFLEARIDIDERRLLALDPTVDLEMLRRNLDSIARICRGGDAAGPIGKLPLRRRFDWLVAPRSTIIQTSAVHTGRCSSPAEILAHLIDSMVRVARD